MLSSLFLIAQVAVSQGAPFALAPESKIWIEGDSSVHPWSCKATKFTAGISADPAAEQPARSLALHIPVEAIECGSGLMNGNLRNALKAEDYPTIEYKLITARRLPGDGVILQTRGELSIAGHKRPVNITVDAAVNPDGSIYAIGKMPLKMSDFGVDPPSAMFGAIKTYDALQVKFEIHTVPLPAAHASLP